MTRKQALGLTAALALALILPASAGSVQKADDPVLEMNGTLNGAPFKILVPANWNGALLVHADDASRAERAVCFPPIPLEEPLLEQGYTTAGSALCKLGWLVRIVVWGESTGGLIARASIQEYPRIYDAGVPVCNAGAGPTRQRDRNLGVALAYESAFGWPGDWGPAGDVRDDLPYRAAIYPLYEAQIGDPANRGRFEFTPLVNGLPEGDLEAPPGLWMLMMVITENRIGLEIPAGGPVSRNRDSLYMHTAVDSICAVEQECAYRETVAAAGGEKLLLWVYTEGNGHCAFTPEQVPAVLPCTSSDQYERLTP